MKSNLKVLAPTLIVFAACAALVLTGCNSNHYGEDGRPDETKPAPTSNTRWIAGTGSTFVAPLIDRWGNDYEKSHPVHINYRPNGSGAGIEDLRKYGSFAAQ
jgi:phosphate transport system substrate-binding protein